MESTSAKDYRILRVLDEGGNTTDFKVSAVFLLASEVWEPLVSGRGGYTSDDQVVFTPHESELILDSATRRRCFCNRSSRELVNSRPFVPLFIPETDCSFMITEENFFILARLADKFIITHLITTLGYYSRALIATAVPSYELWLKAARHEMVLVEKFSRNAARMEVGRLLAEKGISYFCIEMGIRPGAMDGIIMDLMRVKDNYIPHRQVRGGRFAMN